MSGRPGAGWLHELIETIAFVKTPRPKGRGVFLFSRFVAIGHARGRIEELCDNRAGNE
jgi:hypothetical protein